MSEDRVKLLLKKKLENAVAAKKEPGSAAAEEESSFFINESSGAQPSAEIRLVKKAAKAHPRTHQAKVHEVPRNFTSCMKFYYKSYEDFVKYNLPCEYRQWVSSRDPSRVGTAAFADTRFFTPGDMGQYMTKHYVTHFTASGLKTPFGYGPENVTRTHDEVHTVSEYTLQPHQKLVAAHMSASTDFTSALVVHDIGSGKCHGIDTPIIKFDGSVVMVQDVQVGDQLMGPDGRPRTVSSLGRGRDVMYRVVPATGDAFVCNSEHILSLVDTGAEIYRWPGEPWFFVTYLLRGVPSMYRLDSLHEATRFLDKVRVVNVEIRKFLEMSAAAKARLSLYRAAGFDSPETRAAKLTRIAEKVDAGTVVGSEYLVEVPAAECKDWLFLVRSVGLCARVAPTAQSLSAPPADSVAVFISGPVDIIPTRIAEKCQAMSGTHLASFSLEALPEDDYYGFTLDQDHLYLLGDFTVCHNTCTAVLIAESNKGYYLDGQKMNKIPGSEILVKTPGQDKHTLAPCNITLVVPKQLIPNFYNEIKGSVESGTIKSCTASCIYVDSEAAVTETGYLKMRQYYAGKIGADGNPDSGDLRELNNLEESFRRKQREQTELSQKIGAATDYEEQQKIIKRMNALKADLVRLEGELTNRRHSLSENINRVYYIVSHDVFLNLISTKRKGGYYAESDFLLRVPVQGKKREVLIHPDCFHSNKSVIIIDEAQKLTRESGTNYLRLYEMLQINARDLVTGEPRVKVVLLTATPVYDNPHEAGLMINLLRPRIQFPMSQKLFNKFFIDAETGKLKNLNLLRYIMSGYISHSRGANPKAYPYRVDKVVVHIMGEAQQAGYLQALRGDVKNSGGQQQKSTDNLKILAFSQSADDAIQGQYVRSRQVCNIYIPPRPNVIQYDWNNMRNRDEDNDRGSRASFMAFLGDLRKVSPDRLMAEFKRYSPKFHYIIEKILNSTDEGPIVVYTEWIWYGILPMVKMLELLGYEFMPGADMENVHDRKRFGIWSNVALEEYGVVGPDNQEKYTTGLQRVFNSPKNAKGALCKVIFITVVEGIDLKRVSQLHVTSPWWNQSKIEQIVGRGIRFYSHRDLPKNKQHVEIYHHCTVLNTFHENHKNEALSRMLCEVTLGRDKYTPAYRHPQDLDICTTEQLVHAKKERKTAINVEFNRVIREVAFDCELNKYGNLVRLQEYDNEHLRKKKQHPDDVMLYNKAENKYYYFEFHTKRLRHLEMKSEGRSRNFWPPMSCAIGDYVSSKHWLKTDVEILVNHRGRPMVSIVTVENLESFNENPVTKDMNFDELYRHSVIRGKEEREVWDYFNKQRVRDKLMSVVSATYGLAESGGSKKFVDSYVTVVTKGLGEFAELKRKIENGTAMKTLVKMFEDHAVKIGDQVNAERFARIFDRMEEPLPLTSEQIQRKKEARSRYIFTVSEDNLERIKKVLILNYNYERNYLEELNPTEVVNLYDEKITADRNFKHKKPNVKYEFF